MYNKGLFQLWVPKPMQLAFVLLTLLAILPAGGLYTANLSVMYPDLGFQPEDLSFANNASTIGMALAMPLIFHVMKHFRFKEIVVGGLTAMAVLNLIASQTDNKAVIILTCFFIGYLKFFVMIVFMLPVMALASPDGDRAKFYGVFYPFSIGVGQIAAYTTSQMAYEHNWRYVPLVMAIFLLGCALLAVLLMHNKRGGKQVKISNIDWISATLLGIAYFFLNYILTYSKTQGWLISDYIVFAYAGFLITLTLFIHRQATVEKPWLPLRHFKTHNVITGIVAILALGMFLATGTLQTAFTTILAYDGPTSNLLNLAMVPGIVLGGLICSQWTRRKWKIKFLVFIGFSAALMYALLMYFLIAPVIEIHYLILPVFFKGMGMCILFIAVSLYVVDKVDRAEMMPVMSVFVAFRTFIGTSLFSAIISWAMYKLQLQNARQLASGIDLMNPYASLRGGGPQLYGTVSVQASLMAIKQIFGYIVIAGGFVLVFNLYHSFDGLHHRRLVLTKKLLKGKRVKGYRLKSIVPADVADTAASAT